jgi:hypothetical protein
LMAEDEKDKKPEPTKEFLKKIEYICSVKGKLPRPKRGKLNVGGVRFRRRELKGGDVQYIVGGLFFPKLLYTMTKKGKRAVHRYKPGAWEESVEEAFKLAPQLRKQAKKGEE